LSSSNDKEDGKKEDASLSEEFLRELDDALKEPVCPECVMCGWCCKQTVCYYGQWDYDRHQCMFLTDDNLCSKYEEIVNYEKSIGLEVGLFGSGCCLNYANPDRIELLKRRNGEP